MCTLLTVEKPWVTADGKRCPQARKAEKTCSYVFGAWVSGLHASGEHASEAMDKAVSVSSLAEAMEHGVCECDPSKSFKAVLSIARKCHYLRRCLAGTERGICRGRGNADPGCSLSMCFC